MKLPVTSTVTNERRGRKNRFKSHLIENYKNNLLIEPDNKILSIT